MPKGKDRIPTHVVEAPPRYDLSVIRKCTWPQPPTPISGPDDAYQLFSPLMKDAGRERFYVLSLDTASRVLNLDLVSVGTSNASIVHPREVFREAVRRGAIGIIVAHNHPLGNIHPSEDDIRLTRRLMQAGQILGIHVIDHLILAGNEYISLKNEGHMGPK